MQILKGSNHLKDKCFWNPNNRDKKLKEKLEIIVIMYLLNNQNKIHGKKGKPK